jgi:hypothetical protein
MQFSCLPRVNPWDCFAPCERGGSGKLFDHYSRGPQHLAVPGKSAFHLPNDRSIFTGILGWLNAHHPLPGTIGLRLRFHFTDIEALKNRHQEMEQIIEVIP